jgi:hypothetical protein
MLFSLLPIFTSRREYGEKESKSGKISCSKVGWISDSASTNNQGWWMHYSYPPYGKGINGILALIKSTLNFSFKL